MVNRILFVDNSIENSDWTKANAFDFPFIETVEDFEKAFQIPNQEPKRTERLRSLSRLPWAKVAPEPIKELLFGDEPSDALVKLLKASFGGDRSAAGRYAANIRWQGQTGAEGSKAKNISEKLKTFFGTDTESFKKSEGYQIIQQKEIEKKNLNTYKGDLQLEVIADLQGFSGKPKVVSSEEMAKLEKEGWTIAYRGIKDKKAADGTILLGEDLAEQFRTGEYYAGLGTMGNGIYFAADKGVAEEYAGRTTPKYLGGIEYRTFSDTKKGAVLKVAIPPDGLMMSGFKERFVKHLDEVMSRKFEGFYGADDIGRKLAAQGVKGVETIATLDGSRERIFIIWDRSMLVVEESEQTK